MLRAARGAGGGRRSSGKDDFHDCGRFSKDDFQYRVCSQSIHMRISRGVFFPVVGKVTVIKLLRYVTSYFFK